MEGQGDYPAGSSYANNTALLPLGTYTPQAFMAGIGSTLQRPPIWNLNLVTDPDPPAQLDTLKAMGVPVEMVELGNEDADQVRFSTDFSMDFPRFLTMHSPFKTEEVRTAGGQAAWAGRSGRLPEDRSPGDSAYPRAVP